MAFQHTPRADAGQGLNALGEVRGVVHREVYVIGRPPEQGDRGSTWVSSQASIPVVSSLFVTPRRTAVSAISFMATPLNASSQAAPTKSERAAPVGLSVIG